MISLTSLDGRPAVVDPDQIESLEATPDTVVTLISKSKFNVKESLLDIQQKIVDSKRSVVRPRRPGKFNDFEDLADLDDHSIQQLLKRVDGNVFAVALRVASDDLLARIYKNMSPRAAVLLKEDVELGPIRLREVADAQRRVVDLIRTFEKNRVS